MERRTFNPGDDPATVPGAVLCRDLSLQTATEQVTLRRGTALSAVLAWAQTIPHNWQLDIVVPAPGEIRQDAASSMVARRIAGKGVVIEQPHQGQVTVRAGEAGLLRVQGEAITQLNRSPLALVATALDGRIVDADEVIAVVKAAALFVPEDELQRLLATLNDLPLLRVAAFGKRRVGLIAGSRIHRTNLANSARHLQHTLSRFGAELVIVEHIADDVAYIARAYQMLLDRQVEVILVAGSIVLDPADPFLLALDRIGATLEGRGAPVDPGTMFWVGYARTVPIFGLASCEMYGRLSVLDLLLPYALAGEHISSSLMATFGYGGLLHDTSPARRLRKRHQRADEETV